VPDAKPILVACCFPFLYGNPPLFRVISSIAFFLPRTEFSCCDVLFVDIPEGVDYRLEDGEIGAGELEDYEQLSEQEEQDGEYDPLMAGSVESDDNGSGPESPDDIASPPASPLGSTSAVLVETIVRSPPASPLEGPASPTSSISDGPASPVEDFELSSPAGVTDSLKVPLAQQEVWTMLWQVRSYLVSVHQYRRIAQNMKVTVHRRRQQIACTAKVMSHTMAMVVIAVEVVAQHH